MNGLITRARVRGVALVVVLVALAVLLVGCAGGTDDGGSSYAVGLDETISQAAERLVDWVQDEEREPAGLASLASDVRDAAETEVPDTDDVVEEARSLLVTAREAANTFADELERVAQLDAFEVADLVALDGSLTSADEAASALREVVEREVDG